MMKAVRPELKKVIRRMKTAQTQFQTFLKDSSWIEEARKYAERQSREVQKLISADTEKLKSFIDRERKELERIQKQIPGEVEKFRKFVNGQKKELEKLVTNLRKANGLSQVKGKKVTKKKAAGTKAKKKAASSKKAAASAAETSTQA